jgi:Patatin-like phospholipase.
MKKLIANIFYSFPIQLVILHLRNNLLLIIVWILITLLMTGQLGRLFGIRYLFLAPEYLGEVSSLSYFFLGLSFGAFTITWNLTSYLLEAHQFPFLASLARPFTKFCLNNFLIPLGFLVLYFGHTIYFQAYNEYREVSTIFWHCLSFSLGVGFFILISSFYFRFTNKDVFSFRKKRKKAPPNVLKSIAPGRQIEELPSVKTGISNWRVDTYLTEDLKTRLVRNVEHYDSSILLAVFKQNHLNALVVQLIAMVVLISLGLAIDNPSFRIPAGASMLVLGCVVFSIAGAITYWFDKWRYSLFVIILVLINYLSTFDIFTHQNRAYGLDYNMPQFEYTYQNLQDVSNNGNWERDKAHTQKILENWKKKMASQGVEKPKMTIFCVSGGGMKAAVWSMQVMQESDSLLNGKLMEHTTLMTGASGGLLGAAYLRELMLKKKENQIKSYYDKKYIENISSDLLNSLTFTIISNDLFLPWSTFQVNGHTYHKDRGYIFEEQLSENTNGAFNKKLSDYYQPEFEAKIPMLFITPSIVNDGRRMIISPHRLSYMTLPPVSPDNKGSLEVDAVDFMTIFDKHGAGDLQFTTALRMNATYPYILPNVYLPTKPAIEVMDAGFRDNYGIMSATRFIHVFKDWIKENTSGVVLVQVVGRDKIQEIDENDNQGMISSLLNPLGIPGQILSLQEYEQDTNLGYIFDLLGDDLFEIIRFIYLPSKDNEMASMTFHLTRRERNDILQSYYLKQNQDGVKRLLEIFKDQ